MTTNRLYPTIIDHMSNPIMMGHISYPFIIINIISHTSYLIIITIIVMVYYVNIDTHLPCTITW